MGKAKVLILAASEPANEFQVLRQRIETIGLQAELALADSQDSREAASCDVAFLEQDETTGRSWRDDVVRLRRANYALPIVLLARQGSEELAVEALRLGLADYVSRPWSANELLAAVQRCLSGRRTPTHAADHASESKPPATRMLGSNPNIRRVKEDLARVASSDSTVLISGETGTGKELAAQFVHENSSRREKPFVCINCAAIPDALLESELFGHTKGAFTGAEVLRDGLLAAADSGTIFLDEIGDMSLFAQAKMLRVLETKEVYRLGGNSRMKLNVRFVAATNRDLDAMTASGAFRKDLYFRVNVVCVQLPPLRERRDDIPLLIEHYSREQRERRGCSLPFFSESCLDCLRRYDWPGNIRELKNVLEALFLGRLPSSFCPEHLPERFRAAISACNSFSSAERDLLLKALSSEHWNKSRAAAKLHWSRMTLYRKMAKYQISRSASRAGIEASKSASNPQTTEPV
jgi:DNA-binding NtrC family response regulator